MALTKITNELLADEFFKSEAVSALDIDWEAAAVFTKTFTTGSTLTFSNVKTGMVKTLVFTGDVSLQWPSGVKWLNGEYDGSATKNIIQLISTNDDTEIFGTISNYTT